MKNKMHACAAVLAMVLAMTAVTQGGMQSVLAAGKTITKSTTVASAKILVSDTTAAKGSNADSSIDIKVGSGSTIDIKVGESKGSSSSAEKVDLSGEVAGISYEKLAMANVEEAVNVRASSSEDSELLGKFYKECAGEILEKDAGWTKIKTGKLTGWVKNDYLLFGADAKRLADSVVEKVATSKTSCLRVRKEPSQDAGIYDLLAEGDTIEMVEDLGEWISVEFADGTVGYVSSEYVTISDEIGKGETIESIRAKEEAERKAKQAESKSKGGSDSKQSGGSDASSAVNNAAAASCDDLTLLAALIQSEAGNECMEGQIAVGNVVMNRLRTGRFGNSLYSVIYAKGQFSPAGSGKVAQICAQGPKATCIQAAQAAMAGTSVVGPATRFRPVSSGYQGLVIGNHVFW